MGVSSIEGGLCVGCEARRKYLQDIKNGKKPQSPCELPCPKVAASAVRDARNSVTRRLGQHS